MTAPYRHPWAEEDIDLLPGTSWTRSRLFHGLTAADLKRIEPHIDLHRLERGDTLVLHGRLGIVLTGALREDACDMPSGDKILGVAFPGDLLCPGGQRVARARTDALTASGIMTCDLDDLARLMEDVSKLATNVIRETQACVIRSVDWFHLRGRQTAMERIAGLIATFSARQGHPETVPLHLTRQDLGHLTALTFETVSRTIKTLERDGIIDLVTPTRVIIRDHARLLHATGTGAFAPLAA